ncbi:MAG: PadR family transcriptional regulator [Actinomycetota bacterium]|nr:PadR family transcriptional regulator [Actinomycetota bacterium]
MDLPVTTFAVLGLVAKRPGSGYDLTAFADRSVRFFSPISRSQLYSELARLEELGWVSGTAIAQERYPNKRVYETTPAGIVALRGWLDRAPQPRQRQRTKDTFVLKVFLGSLMNPDLLTEQLRDYRERAQRLHAELSAVIEHIDALPPTGSRRFGRASARYGVLQAEATIAWTEEIELLLAAEREGSSPAEPE